MPATRQCREYERLWQDRCVDRNLSDDWLLALNNLHAFKLISICEGHLVNRSGNATCPHVNLRLQPEFVRAVYIDWDGISVGLAAEFGRLFNRDATVAVVELKLRMQQDSNGMNSIHDLTVRLNSIRPRSTEEMEPAVVEWMANTVGQCQALDAFFVRRLR